MSHASGKVALVEKKMMKAEAPSFRSGDTVRVHVKIKEGDKERVQIYEGAVIAFNNTGSRKCFTVRKISHGVGVERVFPLFSTSIAKVERIDEGRVRRAKIYYIRGLQGKAARIRSESDMK
jgi:large subunit ribosomal protein L19